MIAPRPIFRLLLAGVAFWTLAWPFAARADDESPLKIVQVGWQGVAAPGAWNPVRVQVRGGAADARARVEVVMLRLWSGAPNSSEQAVGGYGEEIALPANTDKELVIWTPGLANTANYTNAIVRLSVNNQILAEERIRFRRPSPNGAPIIGVLADSPLIERAIKAIQLPGELVDSNPDVVALSAADLPSAPERLRAWRGLVVQGAAPARLTEEQRQAIRAWLTEGGHLVIIGGPDASRAVTALPSGVLAAPVASVRTANLAGLLAYADAPTPPGVGPVAIFGDAATTDDPPLVLTTPVGSGSVTLLAVDPSLEPLASWAGSPTLLAHALAPTFLKSGLGGYGSSASAVRLGAASGTSPRAGSVSLNWATEALPPEVFPNWQLVAALLGGFTIICGPVAHWWLNRTDKRVWLWALTPTVAVALSGAFFAVGVGGSGQVALRNVVGHLRIDPDFGVTKHRIAAGFYAPTHPDYTVTVAGDTPVHVGDLDANDAAWAMFGLAGASSTSMPPFHVVAGRDTRVEFTGQEFSMRTVTVERDLGAAVTGVTANLALDEPATLRGFVQNDTPWLIEDAAVAIGRSGLARLGDLPPGGRAEVELPIGSVDTSTGLPLALRLLGAAPSPGGVQNASFVSSSFAMSRRASSFGFLGYAATALAGDSGLSTPERLRRAWLANLALSDPDVFIWDPSGGVMRLPLTFIGFTRNRIGVNLPTGGERSTYHLHLIEQPLRLTLAPGPFKLAAVFSPPRLNIRAVDPTSPQTAFFGGGVTSSGSTTPQRFFDVASGSTVVTFRPPLPANAKVTAIQARIWQGGHATAIGAASTLPSAPNLPQAGVFSVFNWRTNAWDPLPGDSTRVTIDPAADYVRADGEIRLRVTAPPGRIVRFFAPEVALDGVVE